MRSAARALLAAGLVPSLLAAPAPAQDRGRGEEARRAADEADAFFARGEIPRLEFTVPDTGFAALREQPREYVPASFRENGKTVREGVGVKLKGAAGSFRGIDEEKPGFTVDVNRFRAGQEFHGLSKFHLNNAVQDGTYLHEQLCSELFAAARVPACRVTHARVWLNGKDLGLYVLKEAFDRDFLARHFGKTGGNLYDGGFCVDIDAELEKDSGKGPDDRADLKSLVEACREPDPAARWKRIEERLDVDAFLTLMAMELMTGHWDGYCMNRNNYRVYFDQETGKARFFPHGTDQTFGDPDAAILDMPNALVAEAVMRNPEWRARFRKRVGELLPLFAARERLLPRVEQWKDRLEPVLRAMDAGAASGFSGAVRGLRDRLSSREKSLRDQAKRPEPKTLEFSPRGVARLQGFAPAVEGGQPKLEQVMEGGKRVLAIRCGPGDPTAASWRRRVTLARGKYAFEASVRLKGFAPVEGDGGAGARLVAPGLGEGAVLASAPAWSPLACEFEVLEETRLVELVAAFRGAKGEALFELASLRLVKR